MENELLTEYVHFRMSDDGILEAKYLPEVRKITEPMSRAIVATRKTFQGPKKVCLLVTASKGIQISKEARDYFAGPDGIAGLIATVILIPDNNLVIATLANWLIQVQRPQMPTRIERSPEKAREWLLKKQKLTANAKRQQD